MDEVTGVGDAQFRQKSMGVMRERIQHDKSTVVFVSHNGNQVRQLCNRAVWIEKGEMRAAGETSDVLREYHKFIGV